MFGCKVPNLKDSRNLDAKICDITSKEAHLEHLDYICSMDFDNEIRFRKNGPS